MVVVSSVTSGVTVRAALLLARVISVLGAAGSGGATPAALRAAGWAPRAAAGHAMSSKQASAYAADAAVAAAKPLDEVRVSEGRIGAVRVRG